MGMGYVLYVYVYTDFDLDDFIGLGPGLDCLVMYETAT